MCIIIIIIIILFDIFLQYFCFTALGAVVVHCQPPHTEKQSADSLKSTFYSGAILKTV